MRPHILFLKVVLSDWRWYLNHQRRSISETTEKALHSSLAPKQVDYEVDFVDCQRLERALEKLSVSREVLLALEHIACTLQSSTDRDKPSNDSHPDRVVEDSNEILVQLNKIRGFSRTALALQDRVKRASVLVSLPDLMQDESIKLTALVGKASGLSTNGSARYKHKGSYSARHRGEFTKKAPRGDLGRNSRRFSVDESNDAIFSSDLVYIPPNTSDSEAAVLSVRKAMAIYVVMSLVFTGFMIAASYLWSRHSLRLVRAP
ncbi:MAG: hypothetical protein L6R41_000545 [Letrouitia leprolyta]|nr:MAG: hypothetical protein L6R41_000545 [Letrouitia leprolyta]